MALAPTDVRIEVERLAGRIGAVLHGVDSGDALSDDTIAGIRRSLVEHRVVFLRDQHLDYERQVAFAQRFGPLTLGHPTLHSPTAQPFLEEIDSATGAPAN